MKVLVIAAEFPPIHGGVATFARNLAEAIAQVGHDVRVVTCVGEKGTREEGPFTVTRAGTAPFARRYLKLISLITASVLAVRRHRPAIIMCTRLSHDGVAGLALKWLQRTPYILVVHGSEVLQHRFHPMRRVIVRRVLRSAVHLIANSNYTREIVVDFGIPTFRVTVIHPPLRPEDYVPPNLADVAAVERRYGLEDKRVLLTVGQLTARKGHALVIESLRELLPRYPNLAYAIVGGAGEARPQLEALIDRLGLRDRVVFTGYLPANSLKALYSLCELFVMPCRELPHDVEGFGIAFAEANLFGKPVIGGIGGGTADAVRDGETGLLVDPDDADAVTTAITRLLQDTELATRLGQNGRRRALDELSVSAQLPLLKTILSAAAVEVGADDSPPVARWRETR
jgi:phosphatidylinositol alpha-1,6-mannosyltransferase